MSDGTTDSDTDLVAPSDEDSLVDTGDLWLPGVVTLTAAGFEAPAVTGRWSGEPAPARSRPWAIEPRRA